MKLLVAIDGSKASAHVLEQIAARPWPAGSTAEVLSVVEPSHLWTMSETEEQIVQQAREITERAATMLDGDAAPGLRARAVVMQGDPKSVIADRAKTEQVDLVLVGSHGASAIERFLVGSVASGVVRHAPCSVEIVRERESVAPGVRKILLATDLSPLSEHAAQAIAARPWGGDVAVRVLSVEEYTMPAAQILLEPSFVFTETEKELQKQALERAENAVAAAVQILQPVFGDVSERIAVPLRPAKEEILAEAEEWGADLIVVGSHGREGADLVLLGSVSEAVATHAKCSVEVVRKPLP